MHAFILRLRTRQGCLITQLLSHIVLEILSQAIDQNQKGVEIGKEEIKLSLFMETQWSTYKIPKEFIKNKN